MNNEDLDFMIERFDKSLKVLMHNLGPQLINHTHLGLTPGQVFMLHFIRKENQCTVSKLADKMEVAPSAITVMLDRLEAHGFVSRSRDTTDRRIVIITLTDDGEEKLDQVLEVRKKITQHCFNQMNPNELDSFIGSLEKLSSIAQMMNIQEIMELSNKEE